IVDDAALQAAIDEVSNAQIVSTIKVAVNRYAQKIEGHKPKQKWIDAVCEQLSRPGQKLDDLTLYQFTGLLLHKSRWSDYKSSFNVDDQAIRKLLDDVRETRNALAHFRSEITNAQREQLRFC